MYLRVTRMLCEMNINSRMLNVSFRKMFHFRINDKARDNKALIKP